MSAGTAQCITSSCIAQITPRSIPITRSSSSAWKASTLLSNRIPLNAHSSGAYRIPRSRSSQLLINNPMTKKYNFVPEHQLNTSPSASQFSVSITASSFLYISKFDVSMYALKGKIVRFYADTHAKTIAWKEVSEGSLEDIKNVRTFTPNPASGAVVISIAKLLSAIGIPKDRLPLKAIPVTTYKDTLVDKPFSVIDLSTYIKK